MTTRNSNFEKLTLKIKGDTTQKLKCLPKLKNLRKINKQKIYCNKTQKLKLLQYPKVHIVTKLKILQNLKIQNVKNLQQQKNKL